MLSSNRWFDFYFRFDTLHLIGVIESVLKSVFGYKLPMDVLFAAQPEVSILPQIL